MCYEVTRRAGLKYKCEQLTPEALASGTVRPYEKPHFALKNVAVASGGRLDGRLARAELVGTDRAHHPTRDRQACRSPRSPRWVMLCVRHRTAVSPRRGPALSPGRRQSPVWAVGLGPHFPVHPISS